MTRVTWNPSPEDFECKCIGIVFMPNGDYKISISALQLPSGPEYLQEIVIQAGGLAIVEDGGHDIGVPSTELKNALSTAISEIDSVVVPLLASSGYFNPG